MKKYFTFFIDDNIRFLENLTLNSPRSAFDDNYLRMLKKLHEKYGMKVQLNLFYENDTFNLSQMTDAYKEEFLENKDWLRFGFHAKKEVPDWPYINASYKDVWDDYTLFESEVERFAGKEMISDSLITHWVAMTKEGIQALRDKGAKMMSVTTGDRIEYPEIRSVFSTEHNFWLDENKKRNVSPASVCRRDTNGLVGAPSFCNYNHLENSLADKYMGKIKMYQDADTGMYFNRFAGITMNAVRLCDFPSSLEELSKYEYVGLLIHEQYFYEDYFAYEKDFAKKIDYAFDFLLKKGFTHLSMQDLLKYQ